ncbi:sensor histidine kinase [Bacillus sp. HMF5848]|uniref:sensor histidine kinase n=1 Tax=Bacillus sp. HMF5848 TaxID=2495421 RepID=UPI000F7B29E4|nr:HAMP domain-containing sensor histidine kinase [Bacillus sp. HMF5848]RSK28591.1 sensor histidine kinase [Bacillus sp. HMF5848]
MGVRSRFFTFIIIIVIVPLIVSVLTFAISMSRVVKTIDNETDIETNFYVLEQVLQDSYDQINNSDQFYEKISPYLREFDIEIQIVSLAGTVLFESDQLSRDDRTFNLFDRFNTYTVSIFQNNKKVATANIKASANSPATFTVNGKLVSSVFVSVGAGLITFTTLIVLFIVYVSRHILTPIEQLNDATLLMSDGDFSYPLTYKSRTELGQLTIAFQQMRHRLADSIKERQKQEQSRRELIASISHDLRTPLASIQGYVEALQDGIAEDEATKQKYFATIQVKTKQVNRLIEDLFEFSKLELKQLQMNVQPMNSSFLAEMFVQIEADILQKGARAAVDLNIPSAPIEIDPERILQVIQNLVNNALRYIDDECGVIQLRSYLKDKYFVIEVSDNGTGVAAENLPYIFDRFYRGEKSRSRSYGGAGLGLAISKTIVEAHEGHIDVASEIGKGTTFKINLPIAGRKT